ncbi:MAG: ribonuclease III, partial [Halioglobus sp.]|nr:ribonuclease III [Halioglobus sp.]
IAEALYLQLPRAREGDLSRMRAALVKGETLADVARELELGDFLHLGPGERKSGGKRRGSILADALEAVLGAILLDADVPECREAVLRWFGARLEAVVAGTVDKDPKTQLQEYLQGRGRPLPEYELLSIEGEAHAQRFHVACNVFEPAMQVQGSGSSRRRAEQSAAQTALDELSDGS